MLAAFGNAAEKDDQCVVIFGEIDPVTRPPVNDVFTQAIKALDAGRIAELHTKLGNGHLGGSLRCQTVKPLLVRVGCILADLLFDFDRHVSWQQIRYR